MKHWEEGPDPEPTFRAYVTVATEGGWTTHHLVLFLPVAHGPSKGWGKEHEAPAWEPGVLMARHVARCLPAKWARAVLRALEEGYRPVKGGSRWSGSRPTPST